MDKLKLVNLNRSEKILLFLYELGQKEKKRLLYEDIAVGLFKKYPKDFHLKGYPEYPDSSDSTQRILYEFKKKGYVNASNKIFSITESGIDFVKTIEAKVKGLAVNTSDRLSRNTLVEISRIKSLEGFSIFITGDKEKISENDLYAYLGVSVRTSKSIFMGRVETLKFVIKEIKKEEDNLFYNEIIQYNNFLFARYKETISYFLEK